MQKLPDNQIAFYQTSNGSVNIEVKYVDENMWLSQKLMAELFNVDVRTINEHLKNIFKEKEIEENSVVRKFRITANDGKSYNVNHYNLEAIIAVGYRVNSIRGTEFRQWATNTLKSYIQKGYVLDSYRMKYGSRFSTMYFEELYEEIKDIRTSERRIYQKITDIYATSVDYSPNTKESKDFFATVQNKLHFAITGQTAAEIIYSRVSNKKTNLAMKLQLN